MQTLFRHAFKVGLILAIAVSVPGCALTTPVKKRVDGWSKVVKDDSPNGWHVEKHEAQPAYIPLMFITVPVDIATFPLQVPFFFCIVDFYDMHFCDAGEHNSPDLNGLVMHSSEPSHCPTVTSTIPTGTSSKM